MYARKLLRVFYPDEGVLLCRSAHAVDVQLVDIFDKFVRLFVLQSARIADVVLRYVILVEVERPFFAGCRRVFPHIKPNHEVAGEAASFFVSADIDCSAARRVLIEVVEEVNMQIFLAYVAHVRQVEDYLAVAVEVQVAADVQVAVDVDAVLAADGEVPARRYLALAHVAVEDFGVFVRGYCNVAGFLRLTYLMRIGLLDCGYCLLRVVQVFFIDCDVVAVRFLRVFGYAWNVDGLVALLRRGERAYDADVRAVDFNAAVRRGYRAVERRVVRPGVEGDVLSVELRAAAEVVASSISGRVDVQVACAEDDAVVVASELGAEAGQRQVAAAVEREAARA